MLLVKANEPSNAATNEPLAPETAAFTDAQLASQFASGDRAAMEQVIVLYAERIERLVGRILGWRNDVDDVVQETFIAALRGRKSFRAESKLETWLIRIAVNQCRSYQRKQWVRDKWFVKHSKEEVSDKETSSVTDNPELQAISKERANQVRKAIERLSPKIREVVVLYYLEEMPTEEIANVLSIKSNTVDARLSRARKILHELLEPQD